MHALGILTHSLAIILPFLFTKNGYRVQYCQTRPPGADQLKNCPKKEHTSPFFSLNTIFVIIYSGRMNSVKQQEKRKETTTPKVQNERLSEGCSTESPPFDPFGPLHREGRG